MVQEVRVRATAGHGKRNTLVSTGLVLPPPPPPPLALNPDEEEVLSFNFLYHSPPCPRPASGSDTFPQRFQEEESAHPPQQELSTEWGEGGEV